MHHLQEWVHIQPGRQLIVTPNNDIHIQDLLTQNLHIGYHFRLPALEAPILYHFFQYIHSEPIFNDSKTYSLREFKTKLIDLFDQFHTRSKVTLSQAMVFQQSKKLIQEYYFPHGVLFKEHYNQLKNWLKINTLSVYHQPHNVMISDMNTAQPEQYDHCYVLHPSKMPNRFIHSIMHHPNISFSGVQPLEFNNHFESIDYQASIEYHVTQTHTPKIKKEIRHHSITSLKHHNLCPIIHLCQHHLKIRKEHTHSIMLDRGIIIHNVLEALWQQLEKQSQLILLSSKQRSNMIDHLLDTPEVDRIDYVYEHDSHLLIDYKLQNTPTIKELINGYPDPQLAIYALASPVPLYGMAYGLIRDARFKGIAFSDNHEQLSVIQKPDWHESIQISLSKINQPPTGKPYHKNQCTHCDWRSICRYQETICEDT